MKIVPVLDVMQSVVVRGVAGQREQYRPIQSRLTDSTDVIEVACALSRRYSLTHFYLADLDAITGQRGPSVGLFRRLLDEGFTLAVDGGVRQAEQALELFDSGVQEVVTGTETLASPAELARLAKLADLHRIVVSVDLRAGQSIAGDTWPKDPHAILRLLGDHGVNNILLLDLAQVGTGTGVGTEELARYARRLRPDWRIYVGGGIRGLADLQAARDAGADGVLVASILHDLSVSPSELSKFQSTTTDSQKGEA